MKINYTPKAKADLQQIKADIIEKFLDEELAKEILKKLTNNIRQLESFSSMGIELSKMVEIPTECRYIFCQHNYVFYRVENEGIFIIRILNEKQDYMRILFGIVEVED